MPTPNIFSGKWYNEHRSSMELTIAADGRITGVFQTGVGSPTQNEKFDLVGFAKGDQIGFSVDFSKYGTITSWVGQMADDSLPELNIQTMWLLSANVSDGDEPDKLWNSISTGADVFTRKQPPFVATPNVKKFQRPSHPLK